MGKRSRFKKIKSVDPYNPKKKVVQEKEVKFQVKQRIPRTFTEMMERKQLFEDKGRNKEPKRKGDVNEELGDKRKKKKRKGESNYRFMQRLSDDVEKALTEARNTPQEFPEKKIDPTVSTKQTKTKNRLETLKKKKQHKKNKQQEKEREKTRWTDHVEFGDVVTRPPVFTAKPRKASETLKPGRRDLLLKSTFNQSTKNKGSTVSMARKKALQDERERVIQAYRDLKTQQMQNKSQ